MASTMRWLTSRSTSSSPVLLLDEQRDRHAPGALAADHPVGALLDHRSDAVAALLRNEAGVGDGVHRELAQASGWRVVDAAIRVAAFIFPTLLARESQRLQSAPAACPSR